VNPLQAYLEAVGAMATFIAGAIVLLVVYISIRDSLRRRRLTRRNLRRLRAWYEDHPAKGMVYLPTNVISFESSLRHHGPPGIAPIRPSRYDSEDSSTS
jgi:hypothetical protein